MKQEFYGKHKWLPGIARTSLFQNVCEYQRWGVHCTALPGIYAPTGIIDTKVQIQKDFHRQICCKGHFNRQRKIWERASSFALLGSLARLEMCLCFQIQMLCRLCAVAFPDPKLVELIVGVVEICALSCLGFQFFFSIQAQPASAAVLSCHKPSISFTTYSSKSPPSPSNNIQLKIYLIYLFQSYIKHILNIVFWTWFKM